MGTYRTLFLVAFIYKYATGISLCFGYFSVKWQVENVSLKQFGRSKGLLVLFWIFENEKLFRLCDWTRIRVPTMSTSRPSFSKIIASPELEIYSWIPDKLLRKVKKIKTWNWRSENCAGAFYLHSHILLGILKGILPNRIE